MDSDPDQSADIRPADAGLEHADKAVVGCNSLLFTILFVMIVCVGLDVFPILYVTDALGVWTNITSFTEHRKCALT